MKARLRLETKIASILQEVVVYFTFVAVVLVMVHGHNNVGTKFYTTKAVEDMLGGEAVWGESDIWQGLWVDNDVGTKFYTTNAVEDMLVRRIC